MAALTPRALNQLHSFPEDSASSDQGDGGSSTSVPSSDHTSKTAFPLCDEPPRQFLTSDGKTIVCVHPSSSVDISNTRVSGVPHPSHPKMPSLTQNWKHQGFTNQNYWMVDFDDAVTVAISVAILGGKIN